MNSCVFVGYVKDVNFVDEPYGHVSEDNTGCVEIKLSVPEVYKRKDNKTGVRNHDVLLYAWDTGATTIYNRFVKGLFVELNAEARTCDNEPFFYLRVNKFYVPYSGKKK